jgi:HisJ family histidinol phosphate phosphatase
MHLHSDYSDGKNSLEQMIECAIELGVREISFTDHVRKSTDWVTEYYNHLLYLKKHNNNLIKIHIGVEAKFVDYQGNLDLPETLTTLKQYDSNIRVVGAIHSIPDGNGGVFKKEFLERNPEIYIEAWMNTLKGVLFCQDINCIAHPLYHCENFVVLHNKEDFYSKVLTILKTSKASIEYNVKYNNSIVSNWFWNALRGRLVFGSDSHSTTELINKFKLLSDAQKSYWS